MVVRQNPIRVLALTGEASRSDSLLFNYLDDIQRVQLDQRPVNDVGDFSGYDVVVLMHAAHLNGDAEDSIASYIRQGGNCLAFIKPTADDISSFFGVRLEPAGPHSEIRVYVSDPASGLGQRLPEEFYVHDFIRPLRPVNGDAQDVLHTRWQFEHAPLAISRREGTGTVVCTTINDFENATYRQLVYRLILDLAGETKRRPIGGAVVGFGPPGSVGYLHAHSLHTVSGLALRAVCDISEERLRQAQESFSGIRPYNQVDALARNSEVDLVIVATPPDSHARLAIQLLEAGKHVIVEKPMCITAEDAERMIGVAEGNGRVLSVYQNRRWDVDFLAIKQVVADGLIGDLFHLETFAGDYAHPCDRWHSHRPISGGALYDWGAHYVDWILNLFPMPTASIRGMLHKRVWFDATNADQVRVQITFEGGQEAEFIHSDVAALRKPKWYLLGTEGAIVGEWRDVTVYEPDDVTYFSEHRIPATEIPPKLTMRRKDRHGNMVTQQVSLPARTHQSFYVNMADHLLNGEPLAVTPQSTARVVAVMEAAMRSADNNGTPEALRV